MSVIKLPYALESTTDAPTSSKAFGKISEAKLVKLYAAGPAYIAHSRMVAENLTFAQVDDETQAARAAFLAAQTANGDVDENADIGDEPESKDLLTLDPKQWKDQDHYAVLGLSALRYKATQDQIKRAHRRKVLRHHPDKKAGAAGETNDDSFFKCIAKAHEVLSNPEKRRIFDSADAGVNDEDVPLASQKPKDAEDFVASYAPVFEREGRFSKVQPPVLLGSANASKQEVESFYSFWYNFDSWRSFEYFDKDVNEGSDSRDEKRYAEKKNKSERARRKKEDIARVRGLVDQAMSLDPRIKRIKAEEKAAKEAKKRGSRPGTPGGAGAADKEKAAQEAKAKAEEEKKKEEEAKKQAEVDKADKASAKKAKEAAKKNLKREKKAAQALLTSLNYLLPAGQNPSASLVEAQLTEIDSIMDAVEPTDAPEMRKAMEAAKDDKEAVKKVVIEWGSKAGKSNLKGFQA